MMKLMITLITILVSLSSVQSLYANNTFFLPGDSFFYTRLTMKEIFRLKKQKSPEFTYDNHSNGGFGCGFAGFGTLKIKNMPKSYKEHLLLAYKQLHSSSKKDISVFIYNKSYDWKKHGIAVQYNEDWVNETVAFGHLAEHVRLESFLTQQITMMEAWRDSKRIAPLNTICPEKPEKPEKLEKSEKSEKNKKALWIWAKSSAVLKSSFQMIVIPKRNFDDYHKYNMKKGQRLLVITEKGVESYIIQSKKWVLETPNKEVKKR